MNTGILPQRRVCVKNSSNTKTPRQGCLGGWSAERQDRTVDTAIFSRVLYQLSYLGMRADFTIGGVSVKKMIGYGVLLAKIPSIINEFSQDTLQNSIFL